MTASPKTGRNSPNNGGNDGDEATAMMRRLQSQFGDMNLDALLSDNNNNNNNEKDGNENASNSSSSSSSAMEDPTPEELQAWQAAQFQKGQAALLEKKKKRQALAESSSGKMATLALERNQRRKYRQRRRQRHQRKQQERTEGSGDKDDNEDDDDDDWEEVAGFPELLQESYFFPVSNDDNANAGAHLSSLSFLPRLAEHGEPEMLGGKPWHRLCSSSQGDGLSFARLWQTLDGYEGPTVLLLAIVPSAGRSVAAPAPAAVVPGSAATPAAATAIKTTTTTTLGFYNAMPWNTKIINNNATHNTNSPTEDGLGGMLEDCFLFSWDDNDDKTGIQIVRPLVRKNLNQQEQQQQQPFVFCNPPGMKQKSGTSAAVNASAAPGIGIGGTPSIPRLHVTETLQECRAAPGYCPVWEGQPLLLGSPYERSLYYFDVEVFEVWGVGGDEWVQESLKRQNAQRSVTEAQQRRDRTVDRAQFLDDFQSRIHRVGGGPSLFDHLQHTEDRACSVEFEK